MFVLLLALKWVSILELLVKKIFFSLCLGVFFIHQSLAFTLTKQVYPTGSTVVLIAGQEATDSDFKVFLNSLALWTVIGNLSFLVITDPNSSFEFHKKYFLGPLKDKKRHSFIGGFVGGRATLGKSRLSHHRDRYFPYIFSQQTNYLGELEQKTLIHEIGHGLGFEHEFHHPNFYKVYDMKRFARERGLKHCSDFYVFFGNEVHCQKSLPVNESNQHLKILSEYFDPDSVMNYLFAFNFYHEDIRSSGSRGALSIPSVGDQLGMLNAYPGKFSRKESAIDSYDMYLASKVNYCPEIPKIYLKNESGSPCSRNEYGFRFQGQKICHKNMPRAYDHHYSICREYFDAGERHVISNYDNYVRDKKNVYLIQHGDIARAFNSELDRNLIRSLIDQQKKKE